MSSEKLTVFERGEVLLFDKPLYWTSFDLVNKVRIMIRSATGLKKLKTGHAGTLDPLATGLVVICTGKATKGINELIGQDKEYLAKFFLGKTTPSFDLETETEGEYPTGHITEGLIRETLGKFLGEQQQIPPLHSAKFINGKRAYEYARKGVEMELKPVTVFFREIELLSFNLPEVSVRIVCSKGTYVRSFARDFGKAMGSGCYLSSLVRTASGRYKLENAYTLENFAIWLEQLQQNGGLYV
jgi:tRNA pseudouridine55 synthase